MFQSNVGRVMKDKGIKTIPLLALTGLSSTTLSKARSDSGISECRLSTLARIAKALGVSTKELYEEKE